MGVADIMSTWGVVWPLPRRAARCMTPKRCCSSTTERARLGIFIVCWMRVWVPMMMSKIAVGGPLLKVRAEGLAGAAGDEADGDGFAVGFQRGGD